MGLEVGGRLPEAQLTRMGPNGPEVVALSEVLKGRKVALFALPGAYTGPCTGIHMPSFVKSAEALRAKGIQEIICIAVNDPFVLAAWGESTGATAAGITLLGDSGGDLTRALKMDFTAPHIGLHGRSNRYALVLEDGVITVANIDAPNTCAISTGEELLAKL